jgi:hypothetical protein
VLTFKYQPGYLKAKFYDVSTFKLNAASVKIVGDLGNFGQGTKNTCKKNTCIQYNKISGD